MKDESVELIRKEAAKKGMRVGPISEALEPVEALTTGNWAIDHILGCGGLPLGRSVELYGQFGAGKTTSAAQTAAALQKRIIEKNTDEYILYLDYEHALDARYMEALGLDIGHESFLLTQPDSLEEGADLARRLISTGHIRLAIFDSVAAMTPSVLLEAETGKASVAMRARMMSTLLQQLNPLLHAKRCCAVFLNHEMEVLDMGGRGGPRHTTPGGRALKYYASVRLQFRALGKDRTSVVSALTQEKSERSDTQNVLVKVVKNKVGPPFRQAEVVIRFGKGFDNFLTSMDIVKAHGEIETRGGGWVSFSNGLAHEDMPATADGRRAIRGEAALTEFAAEHPDWRERLIARAGEIARSLDARPGAQERSQGYADPPQPESSLEFVEDLQ